MAVSSLINFENQKTRYIFFISVGILFLAAIFLIYFIQPGNYKVLYRNLNNTDLSDISGTLSKLKIPYEISDVENIILVPSEYIDKARIEISSSGVFKSKDVGFELFDEVEYGLTDFSQKVLLKRALQGELERTISSISGVKFSRVHLVISDKKFLRKNEPSKASVIIFHDNGFTLSDEQIEGVQNLVSSAIPSLTIDNVFISNEYGVKISSSGNSSNYLSGGNPRVKKNYENELEEKISDVLFAIYGIGKFVVKVNTILNIDRREEILEELIGPDKGKVGFIVNKSNTLHNELINIDGKESEIHPKETIQAEKYQYGRRSISTTYGTGIIERISISVLIPNYVTNNELLKVKQAVESAAGVTYERGDQLSIQPVLKIQEDINNSKIYDTGLNQKNIDHKDKSNYTDILSSFNSLSSGFSIFLIVVLIVTISSLFRFFHIRRRVSRKKRDLLLNKVQTWLVQEEKL